ncbi:hypothetical protein GDO81_028523 [Engystomops pustulosus]|uniref:Uncharacterized protein n=1 Tax=Engystomops pustulosus TaxID=76066 RepID=A0AAV6Z5C0_ENGPU|nr:hypothetical protein GDO81_028523 [Engystomops pustulosus]
MSFNPSITFRAGSSGINFLSARRHINGMGESNNCCRSFSHSSSCASGSLNTATMTEEIFSKNCTCLSSSLASPCRLINAVQSSNASSSFPPGQYQAISAAPFMSTDFLVLPLQWRW